MPHNVLATVFVATAVQSPPTDATVPTGDQGTQDANGTRGVRFVIETDFVVTSGTGSATIELYLWDGSRWAKAENPITLVTTSTTSGPASRRVFEIDQINPYVAIDPVVSAISGTGASLTVRTAAR